MRRRPGWIDVLGAGLLPGLLAGTQIAGLLFFLNPGLPFSAAPVARGIVLYGSLLGAVSLALALPWSWGRPRRARRMLPWGLTIALAAAAVLDASQASIYAYFLPSGINDRLVKAALWLSLAALICFYTALLHGLSRRSYGLRSRLGLTMVAVLSVYVMVERREAFQPRARPETQPFAVEPGKRPRLWVIGLDGATLDALLPLAGQGRLPFLASLLQQGAHGRLQSLTPHRPEPLWTTLGTGRYPYHHGVMGGGIYDASFLAPGAELHLLPVGIAFRRWGTLGRPRSPSAGARTASMLWEILPRLGLRSGVVSWPESSRAAISPSPSMAAVADKVAFNLTDSFFRGLAGSRGALPPELAARARSFRVDPRAIPSQLLSRFGPAAGGDLREALAEDLWRQSIGQSLVRSTPDLDAFFLVLPGLEKISRGYFGGYSAATAGAERAERARSHVFTDAAQIVAAYYSDLDALLEQLWRSALQGENAAGTEDRPTLVAIVSAYGFESPGGLWERLHGEVSRTAALGGRTDRSPDGVLILSGQGIAPGALITGAHLVDVVPTLLYGLGFPVARDLDGHVLTAAFDKGYLARHPLTFLPSYERLTRTALPRRSLKPSASPPSQPPQPPR